MSESVRICGPVAQAGRLAARYMHALGWWMVCFCIAACVLVAFTASVASFDLDRFARLHGNFWIHFADATHAQRAPVLKAMGVSLALTTLFVAWVRTPRRTTPQGDHNHDP